MLDLEIYPGGDLVAKGLEDLRKGIVSDEALLVTIASPPLRRLGLDVPYREGGDPNHALFSRLEDRLSHGAHTAYNALVGRVVSFAASYGMRHP